MKVKVEIIKRYDHIGTFLVITRVDDSVTPPTCQLLNGAGEWEDANSAIALRNDHYIKVTEY